MFIARISRGRTIRQFVTGVMLVPSVVSLIWFAIFGGGAIGLQERAERAGRAAHALVHLKADGTPDLNFDTILFDLLNAMPVHKVVLIVLMVLAVVLVAIFFVTGADSASIVMGGLSENGATDPSRFTVVFWGVATGGVASAMLLAGGDDPREVLTGLRDITIVSALPFVFVMLLLCVSLISTTTPCCCGTRWPTRSWSTRSPPRSRRPTSRMRSRPSSCTPACHRPLTATTQTTQPVRVARTALTRPRRT